jgi:hypothetical protein
VDTAILPNLPQLPKLPKTAASTKTAKNCRNFQLQRKQLEAHHRVLIGVFIN